MIWVSLTKLKTAETFDARW